MELFGDITFLLATLIISGQALVQSPPRIINQPPNDVIAFQVVDELNKNDKPFTLECTAEGNPPPRFRWIKNGKHFDWQADDGRISQLPGRGTLVFTSPRNEDMGQYQCFAENEWGIATSNSVFVKKAELNSFNNEPPMTLSAEEGKPFKLKCNPPYGWPQPNVNWLTQNSYGGIRSINNSRLTVDPEGNLLFSNVTQADASNDFTYACAVTSIFRSEYKLGNRVLLNVIPSGVSSSQNGHEPVIQYLSKKNEVAVRGKKIELFCIYGGTPLPQIRWTKNGGDALSSQRTSLGRYGKSLIIKHVNFEDEGVYVCEASNGIDGTKSHTVNLRVKAAPYFIEEPKEAQATEGEDVTITCNVLGVPGPHISWLHNGKPLWRAPSNPRRSTTSNTITIKNLVKNDTGNYGCNATNSLGYVYKDVYINVIDYAELAPEITEPPTDKNVLNGTTVYLTCRASGSPKPAVQWTKTGLELGGDRFTVMDNGDLKITNVITTDSGHYTCHASNKLGSTEASAMLTVE